MKNRKIKTVILEFVKANPGKTRDEVKKHVWETAGGIEDNWYTGRCLKDLIKSGKLIEIDGKIEAPAGILAETK